MTSSADPGTLKPPVPPDTFDQLAVLFQLDVRAATQKRAAKEIFEKLINKIANKHFSANLIEHWISLKK
jgi:hypothetical protein